MGHDGPGTVDEEWQDVLREEEAIAAKKEALRAKGKREHDEIMAQVDEMMARARKLEAIIKPATAHADASVATMPVSQAKENPPAEATRPSDASAKPSTDICELLGYAASTLKKMSLPQITKLVVDQHPEGMTVAAVTELVQQVMPKRTAGDVQSGLYRNLDSNKLRDTGTRKTRMFFPAFTPTESTPPAEEGDSDA